MAITFHSLITPKFISTFQTLLNDREAHSNVFERRALERCGTLWNAAGNRPQTMEFARPISRTAFSRTGVIKGSCQNLQSNFHFSNFFLIFSNASISNASKVFLIFFWNCQSFTTGEDALYLSLTRICLEPKRLPFTREASPSGPVNRCLVTTSA